MPQDSLTPEEFVAEFVALKNGLVRDYLDAPDLHEGGAALDAIGLDKQQRAAVGGVLDAILKDALYTVLLALDGEAALGKRQVHYKLLDGAGNQLSGLLEGPAYEAFQE